MAFHFGRHFDFGDFGKLLARFFQQALADFAMGELAPAKAQCDFYLIAL